MYTRTDTKRRLAVTVLYALVALGCSDDMMGPQTPVDLEVPSQAVTTQDAHSRETLPAPSFAVAAIDDAIGRVLPALGNRRSVAVLGSELQTLMQSMQESGPTDEGALDRALASLESVTLESAGGVSAADLDVIRLALEAARSGMAEDLT